MTFGAETSHSEIMVRNRPSMSLEGIDLVVAAAGYEPRCTHVLTALESELPSETIGARTLLVEMRSHRNVESRVLADEVFRRFEPRDRLEVDADDGFVLRERV